MKLDKHSECPVMRARVRDREAWYERLRTIEAALKEVQTAPKSGRVLPALDDRK